MIQIFDTIKEKGIISFDFNEDVERFDLNEKWIHLSNPTDREIENVAKLTGIPEDALKTPLDPEERPHIEREDEYTLTIVDIPIIEEDEDASFYTYSTIPFGFIETEKTVVTICLNETSLVNSFINGKIKDFSCHKKTRFLLQFLYLVATKFLQYLKQIDKASQRVQSTLEKSMKNKELMELLELEKSLVYFSTSLRSNQAVLDRIARGGKMYEEDDDLLDDVIIENRQAIEMASIYSDILTGTMDAYASIISNNLNIVMKVLTVVTIMISIPSMIASLWGMNTGVPFEGQAWGFWVVLGISIVSCIACGIVLFKKKMLK